MKRMTIKRFTNGGQGTFGVLMQAGEGGRPLCLTLERPWLDNRPDVSSIPAGLYTCRRTLSPRFGETFEVTGVPGRTVILFHKGNTIADSSGCVLLGERFGTLGGSAAVLGSAQAFSLLMRGLSGMDEFELRVQEV